MALGEEADPPLRSPTRVGFHEATGLSGEEAFFCSAGLPPPAEDCLPEPEGPGKQLSPDRGPGWHRCLRLASRDGDFGSLRLGRTRLLTL